MIREYYASQGDLNISVTNSDILVFNFSESYEDSRHYYLDIGLATEITVIIKNKTFLDVFVHINQDIIQVPYTPIIDTDDVFSYNIYYKINESEPNLIITDIIGYNPTNDDNNIIINVGNTYIKSGWKINLNDLDLSGFLFKNKDSITVFSNISNTISNDLPAHSFEDRNKFVYIGHDDEIKYKNITFNDLIVNPQREVLSINLDDPIYSDKVVSITLTNDSNIRILSDIIENKTIDLFFLDKFSIKNIIENNTSNTYNYVYRNTNNTITITNSFPEQYIISNESLTYSTLNILDIENKLLRVIDNKVSYIPYEEVGHNLSISDLKELYNSNKSIGDIIRYNGSDWESSKLNITDIANTSLSGNGFIAFTNNSIHIANIDSTFMIDSIIGANEELSLNKLKELNGISIPVGNVLISSEDSTWINKKFALTELNDINISNKTPGYALVVDDNGNNFVLKDTSNFLSTINYSRDNGKFLKVDGINHEIVTDNIPRSFSELSDVNFSTDNDNVYIVSGGSLQPIPFVLTSLKDVNIDQVQPFKFIATDNDNNFTLVDIDYSKIPFIVNAANGTVPVKIDEDTILNKSFKLSDLLDVESLVCSPNDILLLSNNYTWTKSQFNINNIKGFSIDNNIINGVLYFNNSGGSLTVRNKEDKYSLLRDVMTLAPNQILLRRNVNNFSTITPVDFKLTELSDIKSQLTISDKNNNIPIIKNINSNYGYVTFEPFMFKNLKDVSSFEPSVHNYKYLQIVDGQITYTTPSGGGTGGSNRFIDLIDIAPSFANNYNKFIYIRSISPTSYKISYKNVSLGDIYEFNNLIANGRNKFIKIDEEGLNLQTVSLSFKDIYDFPSTSLSNNQNNILLITNNTLIPSPIIKDVLNTVYDNYISNTPIDNPNVSNIAGKYVRIDSSGKKFIYSDIQLDGSTLAIQTSYESLTDVLSSSQDTVPLKQYTGNISFTPFKLANLKDVGSLTPNKVLMVDQNSLIISSDPYAYYKDLIDINLSPDNTIPIKNGNSISFKQFKFSELSDVSFTNLIGNFIKVDNNGHIIGDSLANEYSDLLDVKNSSSLTVPLKVETGQIAFTEFKFRELLDVPFNSLANCYILIDGDFNITGIPKESLESNITGAFINNIIKQSLNNWSLSKLTEFNFNSITGAVPVYISSFVSDIVSNGVTNNITINTISYIPYRFTSLLDISTLNNTDKFFKLNNLGLPTFISTIDISAINIGFNPANGSTEDVIITTGSSYLGRRKFNYSELYDVGRAGTNTVPLKVSSSSVTNIQFNYSNLIDIKEAPPRTILLKDSLNVFNTVSFSFKNLDDIDINGLKGKYILIDEQGNITGKPTITFTEVATLAIHSIDSVSLSNINMGFDLDTLDINNVLLTTGNKISFNPVSFAFINLGDIKISNETNVVPLKISSNSISLVSFNFTALSDVKNKTLVNQYLKVDNYNSLIGVNKIPFSDLSISGANLSTTVSQNQVFIFRGGYTVNIMDFKLTNLNDFPSISNSQNKYLKVDAYGQSIITDSIKFDEVSGVSSLLNKSGYFAVVNISNNGLDFINYSTHSHIELSSISLLAKYPAFQNGKFLKATGTSVQWANPLPDAGLSGNILQYNANGSYSWISVTDHTHSYNQIAVFNGGNVGDVFKKTGVNSVGWSNASDHSHTNATQIGGLSGWGIAGNILRSTGSGFSWDNVANVLSGANIAPAQHTHNISDLPFGFSNSLIPNANGNNGKFLQVSNNLPTWISLTFPTELPSLSGNNGKFLQVNNNTIIWSSLNNIPDYNGKTSQYLQVMNSSLAWVSIGDIGTGSSNFSSLSDVNIASLSSPTASFSILMVDNTSKIVKNVSMTDLASFFF